MHITQASGITVKYDDTQIELTEGYINAVKNLLRQELLMMRKFHKDESGTNWSAGSAKIIDLASSTGIQLMFGGKEDKEWLENEGQIFVEVPSEPVEVFAPKIGEGGISDIIYGAWDDFYVSCDKYIIEFLQKHIQYVEWNPISFENTPLNDLIVNTDSCTPEFKKTPKFILLHKHSGNYGEYVKHYTPTSGINTTQIELSDGSIYFAPSSEFLLLESPDKK